jgi:FtsH-binding integral membrane protein
MVCLWGLLIGLIYWRMRKHVTGAVVLGLCVVSHWVLDLVVHRPDLPLVPGDSPHVGLGLWNSLAGTLAVEGLLFVAGLALYIRVTRPTNKAGRYGFWGLAAFLVLIYVANLFGPTPTSTTAIAWVGQLQWLLVIWAYWVDRHRTTRSLDEGGATGAFNNN